MHRNIKDKYLIHNRTIPEQVTRTYPYFLFFFRSIKVREINKKSKVLLIKFFYLSID